MCDAMCQAALYRFGTSRGNLLISFVKFSSFFFFFVFFHLCVFLFSILPCLFDLLFRKLKEKDCLAPSWCWVMTAHSFVVASPGLAGHQLFSPSLCTVFLLHFSLFPKSLSLIQTHSFLSNLFAVRCEKTVSIPYENILYHRGKCVQRKSNALLHRNSLKKSEEKN